MHILPHWNLAGHEGEEVDVWVYTNMDEVELTANGRNLGRRKVVPGGYASFRTVYRPGKLTANGYKGGKRVMRRTVETTGPAAAVKTETVHEQDGVRIINATVTDRKGRTVPDACPELTISLPAGVTLLGAGNGDPAFRSVERPAPGTAPDSFTIPAFNGHAQFIVRGTGPVTVTLAD